MVVFTSSDIWNLCVCHVGNMGGYEARHTMRYMGLLTHWAPGPTFIKPDQLDPQINSLAPGRSECDSKNVIFNLVLVTRIFRSSHDNALRWMPQGLTDDKSTLVQVMAWCRQATSHYLSQCWPRFMSPYGVTRPQLTQWALGKCLTFIKIWIIFHDKVLHIFIWNLFQCALGIFTMMIYLLSLICGITWCRSDRKSLP